MGVGFNYMFPMYREIRFNSDEQLVPAGLVFRVPEIHEVIKIYSYQELVRKKGELFANQMLKQAPSGVELMVVTSP